MILYHPREDSFLLEKYVKKYASGRVLDMGTGTGVQAVAAALKKSVKNVLAVDVDTEAVRYCKKTVKNKKIAFLASDLFSSVHGQFDTIIFNPPYLPEEHREEKDVALALSGGRRGYELIARFLGGVGDFLKNDGQVLLVFSSMTNKQVVDHFIEEHGLSWQLLEMQPLFMEQLYCYRIIWNPVLAAVKKRGVTSLTYFTHGKRGLIFVGRYKRKKASVKIKRPESLALGRIENETVWLKKVNRSGIGPRLLFAGNGFIVYEFVAGEFIFDFVRGREKTDILPVLVSVLRQCFQLDKLGVAKEEMHHPVKHIIVSGRKATLIDFERAHNSKKPKNVTQFVQFVCTIEPVLRKKGFRLGILELRRLAGTYKKYPHLKNLKKIIGALK